MQGQVHGNIRKEISRRLTELQKRVALERNKKWLGWEGDIIVDEKVKDGVSGRNHAYKQIVIRQDLPLGTIVRVKIVEAKNFFLVGLPHQIS